MSQDRERTEEVIVRSIGARGDGIADSPAARFYIPFAAPGDRLRVMPGMARGAGREATIVELLATSADRIAPRCRHFGHCGGCALQHIADPAVAAHKRRLLQDALAHRGLGVEVHPTVTIPPGNRRRVSFALHRAGRPTLGFNRRASRQVFDLAECAVLAPRLLALVSPLRDLLAPLRALGRAADVRMTLTASGVDLLLVPERPQKCDLEARMALAQFAEAQDLARVSWQADRRHGGPDIEPIVQRRPPQVAFADATVHIPPDAFLQPSAEGERALARLVVEAVGNAPHPVRRIADLYAGCGSLTFPLAQLAPVHAVDGAPAMIGALAQARERRPVATDIRDLARRPLTVPELAQFDAVVFDPPRAGARGQAEAIARTAVPTVVAVSCNPATLARDLRILVDGGYRIESATPLDQFAWSAHVEAVAVLRR